MSEVSFGYICVSVRDKRDVSKFSTHTLMSASEQKNHNKRIVMSTVREK